MDVGSPTPDRLSDPVARALASGRAWGLLGDLFRRGLVVDTVPAWQGSGHLSELGPEGLEAYAAAHTRLFLVEVSPHESVFLSADGLLGGDVAAAVRADRARAGLGDPVGVEPDHLGAECAWMAFLSGAEADARRDGVDPAPILTLQREVLDRHLLRWLPQVVEALEGVGVDGFGRLYVDAATLALALARSRFAELGGVREAWSLPPAKDPLASAETGIYRISEHLCLPVQVGGWWTRSALVAIGRRLDLPAGFGNRVDLVEGLFHAAAQYGRVPELCGALAEVARGWADRGDGPWVERARGAVGLLERVGRGA